MGKKKRLLYGVLLPVMLLLFAACGKENEEQVADTQDKPTDEYSELKAGNEVTISGDCVRLVLPEDGALPYRWEATFLSENVSVTEEYTVDRPAGVTLAAGSAPQFHVFVITLGNEDDEAEAEFYDMWVNSREKTDAAESRSYRFVYGENGWELELAFKL